MEGGMLYFWDLTVWVQGLCMCGCGGELGDGVCVCGVADGCGVRVGCVWVCGKVRVGVCVAFF